MPEDRQIYQMRAEIFVLAYDPKDAEEQLHKQVVVEDLLTEPVPADWSHFDEPHRYLSREDRQKQKQDTITRITREIQQREK